MTATQTFVVTVLDYLDLTLGFTNVQGSQTAEIPIYLASSEGVTNLLFNIVWPGERFTNTSLIVTAPNIVSNLFQDQFTNLLIALQTAPGQLLQSTQQQILKLRFTAVTNQCSAFVPLAFGAVEAVKPGDVGYSNYVLNPTTIAVVQDKPLLIAGVGSNRTHNLTLIGRLNEGYQLQSRTSLAAPWSPVFDYVQTNSQITINLNSTNPIRFYRVYQP